MSTDPAPRVLARFQPQVWINDYAVDIDGAYEFDVTAAVLEMGREKAEAIEDFSYESDELWQEHPISDERPHIGPFSVTVEDSIRDYFARLDAEGDAGRARLTGPTARAAREETLPGRAWPGRGAQAPAPTWTSEVAWRGREVRNRVLRPLLACAAILLAALACAVALGVLVVAVALSLPVHLVLRALGRRGFLTTGEGRRSGYRVGREGFRRAP